MNLSAHTNGRSRDHRPFVTGLLSCLVVLACAVGQAQERQQSPSVQAGAEHVDSDVEFFERRIRPVLIEHCYECHSQTAAEEDELQGGLLLDSRESVLRGGDSGSIIDFDDVDSSLLLQALRYDSLEMPPSAKLSADVIGDFAVWIRRGLPDPRQGSESLARPGSAPSARLAGFDLERGRAHWCYQPITRPDSKHGESDSMIDDLITQMLDAEGISQAGIADRRILARRLYFDLTGLPPSPEQLERFTSDASPAAYERLVDRLIASPAFGERWGRHWLDVVRYADSITLRGQIFAEAWRYRDYVIDAFNQDLPFDEFVRQQIAGDLLPTDSVEQSRRFQIATTFLVLGNHNMEDQDKEKLMMDVVDEQLNVIGRGFLAQTISCARCHDHKFDPIPTRDYYAMAGILRNTQSLVHANVSKWVESPLPVPPQQASIARQHDRSITRLRKQLKDLKASDAHTRSDSSKEIKELEAAIRRHERWKKNRPKSMTVLERKEVKDLAVHVRGNVHNLGEPVPRGFLQVMESAGLPIPEDESGRRQLADWMVDSSHPLTARVIANRLWHWLTGTGLVRTTDNFGATGETPSHPQLLDYLASRLIESGWSIKTLVREIVLSRTYRLSSDPRASLSNDAIDRAMIADPENRLHWRRTRRRLDAECLLDSMLVFGGELQTQLGGSTIREKTKDDFHYDHGDNRRRAIYWPAFRNSVPQLLEVFDFANSSMVVGARNQSNTPSQSLFMMNNPWVIDQARRTAERLLESDGSDNDRVERLFLMTTGRRPSRLEAESIRLFLSDSQDENRVTQWTQVVQSLFTSLDFQYVR